MSSSATDQVDIVDNWEDIEESGILERNLVQSNSAVDSSPEQPEIMSRGPVIMQQQPNRLFHPGQGVKILQRPPRNSPRDSDGSSVNGEQRPKQPMKTLQQREQEYAEARLRILGEAKSPEEKMQETLTDERIQKIQNKMEALRADEAANVLRLPKGPDGTRGFHERR